MSTIRRRSSRRFLKPCRPPAGPAAPQRGRKRTEKERSESLVCTFGEPPFGAKTGDYFTSIESCGAGFSLRRASARLVGSGTKVPRRLKPAPQEDSHRRGQKEPSLNEVPLAQNLYV